MVEHLTLGIIVFPRVQQLDLTGPYEVFASMDNVNVLLVAASSEPVESVTKLVLKPDTTFKDCPQLDIVTVPGGSGVNDLLKGPAAEEVQAFLHRQAPKLRYITSVCTGSFVLAAAGLLKGVRCTSHWAFADLLEYFDAIPVPGQRLVEDGKYITGGGVTCGIDFALTIVSRLRGDMEAKVITLHLEYDPSPPFADVGSPLKAPQEVLAAARKRESRWRTIREDLIAEVTGRHVEHAGWAT